MLALELPHWLMIAGGALVTAGLVGLTRDRNKRAESAPVMLPGNLSAWRSEVSGDGSAAAVPDRGTLAR